MHKAVVLSRNKFLSVNKEGFEISQGCMRKLTLRKIRWIIRELNKGELSVYRIAKQQKVTQRWVRQLPKKYAGIPLYKIRILSCGRKRKPIPEEEKRLVLNMKKKHPMGAVNLEKLLKERGKHIPHNRIHKILKEAGLAKTEPKKSKKRRWVRYERRYSNSLSHADWFEKERKHILLVEDDASRFITGFGVFPAESSKNAVKVVEKAFKEYGVPKQLMTDHGSSFTAQERDGCAQPRPTEFQKCLIKHGVKHIKARVKHPQSNGKVERVFQSIYKYKLHFGSWEKAVEYYNFRRPHMSLENGKLRTPYQAFLDKARKAKIV